MMVENTIDPLRRMQSMDCPECGKSTIPLHDVSGPLDFVCIDCEHVSIGESRGKYLAESTGRSIKIKIGV